MWQAISQSTPPKSGVWCLVQDMHWHEAGQDTAEVPAEARTPQAEWCLNMQGGGRGMQHKCSSVSRGSSPLMTWLQQASWNTNVALTLTLSYPVADNLKLCGL